MLKIEGGKGGGVSTVVVCHMSAVNDALMPDTEALCMCRVIK